MLAPANSLLNTVKQGSQLYKESAESTSSLAAAAGQPQTPGSPMETAVIGGTPSQSKMAGTPAALQGQTKQVKLPPSLLLATQQRQAQSSPIISAEAQRADDIAKRLSSLGSLGSTVPNMIKQGLQAELAGAKVVPQIDSSKLSSFNLSAQDQASLASALQTAADPAQAAKHKQAFADIANLTGDKSILTAKSADEASSYINSFFTSVPQSISSAIQNATPATLTLGSLGETPSALGYFSWDSLAADLGVKGDSKTAADTLKNMTVSQLGDVVSALKRTGYQSEQEWISVLQDPTASPSDKESARNILNMMGASGVAAAEKSVANLSSQVQAANTVTVNFTGTPQSVSLDNIFQTPELQGAVQILLNPQNPSYQSVSQSNPELAKWVNANATELTGVMKNVKSDYTQFAAQNAANAQILNTALPNTDTRDKIGKLLFPDWGRASTNTYSLDAAPLLKNLSQFDSGTQANIQSAIDTLVGTGVSDSDLKSFLNAKPDQITRLGLNTTQGLQNFNAFWNDQKFIRSIGSTTDLSNPETMLTTLTGESSAQLAEDADRQAKLQSLGFTSDVKVPKTLSDAMTIAGPVTSVDMVLQSGKLPSSVKSSLGSLTKAEKAFSEGTSATATLASLVLAHSSSNPLAQGDIDSAAQNYAARSFSDLPSFMDKAKNLGFDISRGTLSQIVTQQAKNVLGFDPVQAVTQDPSRYKAVIQAIHGMSGSNSAINYAVDQLASSVRSASINVNSAGAVSSGGSTLVGTMGDNRDPSWKPSQGDTRTGPPVLVNEDDESIGNLENFENLKPDDYYDTYRTSTFGGPIYKLKRKPSND